MPTARGTGDRRPTAAGRARPASPVRFRLPALAAALLAVVVTAGSLGAGATTAATTWSRNLWVPSAAVYQDPYFSACTAAAVMTMLNTIAGRSTGGDGFAWTAYRVRNNETDREDVRDMMSIFAFERANDTLRAKGKGSDAHGWRNALNAYGWGADTMADPARRVYEDRAYRTFGGAVKAAVRAIARYGMPVGILGWAGGHAQVMTGYVVTGADPRVSSDFSVVAVYLFDPLRSNRTVNRRLSLATLRDGPLRTRFQRYRATDSPYDDPLTSGAIRSSVSPSVARSEWFHRWVLVAPVRMSGSAPIPTPTPTPTPPPTATSAPTPEPPPPPAPTPPPMPTPEPTPEPTPVPTPEAPQGSPAD